MTKLITLNMFFRNYRKWHELKLKIECIEKLPFFREEEVWWCALGANVGSEEDGKNCIFERPVLVFRKFNRNMMWALPLSSKKKEGRFYYAFDLHGKHQVALLSQLRLLSGKRLIRRMGKISDTEFSRLQSHLLELLKETDPLRGPRVPNGNSSFTLE